jgi:hypothetical protein
LIRGAEGRCAGFGTGVELITAEPVKGVPSKDEAFGVRNCWG